MGVFTTIARVVADRRLDLNAVVERLEEITGFETLQEVLNKHFVQRGHILRCYRVAGDAREVLNEIRYTHLPELRKGLHQERERLDRFLRFIRGAGGDAETARELENFVRNHLDVDRRVKELETLHGELDAELSSLFLQLLEYNDDFEILQKLEDSNGGFSKAEVAELRSLLGLYGGEVEKRLPLGAVNADTWAGGRCIGGTGRRRRRTIRLSMPWPTGPIPATA